MTKRLTATSTSEDHAAAIIGGDRRALARAITMIESQRADHRADAAALLDRLLPASGKSVRLGISGPPGVGKSTFIENFGLHVIGEGHRLAVLAIDPSSKIGGGSILGDKTRMAELAKDPSAFIRPSPAGDTLGGVARRTRDAIVAVEAAGFDVVIVETVGVGQSETAVAEMVDMFLLLLPPAGGDELQGVKRGIVELADLILVNKADGDLQAAAGRTASDYSHAIRLLRAATPGWTPEVRQISALTGTGISDVWQLVLRFKTAIAVSGLLARRRSEQAKTALWNELSDSLLTALRADADIAERLADYEVQVAAGRLSTARAAQDLLNRFLGRG